MQRCSRMIDARVGGCCDLATITRERIEKMVSKRGLLESEAVSAIANCLFREYGQTVRLILADIAHHRADADGVIRRRKEKEMAEAFTRSI